ncbi:urate oxidase [Actinoplanes campanulatus]|uniref:Uricase n=1 Tax=Actinoplanes campanulatus TaxID=113559 RepID=A0A7W5AAL5_9ACTN|nr:urate oxidase [Actinoplanes campanulatus]MBB3092520.1 urate oxidase [Actinoplanes campanulatus]GGM97091.1 uricase [Actinoplanes campanulatus]GID34386.1 uricase [Actinoplanes campanulatus]
MAIVLGPNRYGKAETRLVRVHRDGETHGLVDFNVSAALSGDLTATHLTGDNSGVLPTDTMKNTAYAFARKHGVGEPEAFALLLARHFVATQPQVHGAKVSIESFAWDRLGPHSFRRRGDHTRTTVVTVTEEATQVVSGVTGLVLLNSTDSEFHGFVQDEFTTLPPATDRILATAVDARWRHRDDGGDSADWAKSFEGALDALVGAFVGTYSYSLQQTLYAMGSRLLEARPEVAEVRLALPNKHHYLADLSPFGLDNPNEVFIAGDRPYGLIEGSVTRDDAPPATAGWWL